MVLIFARLADVREPDLVLYETRGGVHAVAKNLTLEDAWALPPSIRAEWERETGVRLGARDGRPFVWGGKMPQSSGEA